MATGTEALVAFDQRRWLIVLEVAAGTTPFTEYRRGGLSYVPICFVALETGAVLHTCEKIRMTVLAFRARARVLAVHGTGQPQAVIRQDAAPQ
jgi:hypothetical protein